MSTQNAVGYAEGNVTLWCGCTAPDFQQQKKTTWRIPSFHWIGLTHIYIKAWPTQQWPDWPKWTAIVKWIRSSWCKLACASSTSQAASTSYQDHISNIYIIRKFATDECFFNRWSRPPQIGLPTPHALGIVLSIECKPQEGGRKIFSST